MAINFSEEKQNKQLALLRRKEEEQSVQRLSQKTNIPYIDLTSITIETDALALIPKQKSEEIEAACFKLVGKDVYVAIRSPEKPGLREELFRLQHDGYRVGVYLASRRSLEKAWTRYADIAVTSKSRSSFLDISPAALENISQSVQSNEQISDMVQKIEASEDLKRITQLIEIMLGSSIATNSSDIHIEPQEESVMIRYRQDGILHDITTIKPETYKKVNSRIKILSRLKLTQDKQAQDGRFTIDFKDQEIEIRTSIIPGSYGESIVMRVLNPDTIGLSMKKLGIEPKLFEVLRREIHKPNGLILTTGPTGSGKTTTLYSFLKEIYSPQIKILTIEDPIEYHLDGITQTQVNPAKGYTFLSGLRGGLRQDPDAIMVGEIRDKETAEIAVNASLTGHIVLSTLHTNNAAGAIPRMLDLGINPKVLPSALTVSIAQRLVRKLVPECSEAYTPDEDTQKLIRSTLKQAERNGKDLSAYGVSADQDIVLYRPKKDGTCAIGNGSGYKGRVGIFEAILMNEDLEQLIPKNPSEREIRRIADKQGLLTMQEDGILKALAGVTSLEEINKTVDLTEYLDKVPTQPKQQKPLQKEPEKSTPSPTIEDVPGFTIPTEGKSNTKKTEKEPTIQTSMNGSPDDIQDRIAKIEASLDRVANLLEKTATQKMIQPQNTTALRSIRQNQREYQQDLASLEETLQTTPPKTDITAAEIADKIRDLELLMLLEDIEKLEQEQREKPSTDISAQLANTRKTIINVIRANPPQKEELMFGDDGQELREELRVILDRLFELERKQLLNPNESAAEDLAQAKRHIDEVLTTS